MNESIPLWLDLKKEYIDDNFERLLDYLSKNSSPDKADTFYTQTLSLLKMRADDVADNIFTSPVYEDDPEREILIFNIRLLSLAILILKDSARRKEFFLAIIHQLILLLPKYAEKLTDVATDALKASDIINPGFSIRDLPKFLPEVFVNKLVGNCSFGPVLSQKMVYDGFGRCILDKDGLTLTATGLSYDDERLIKMAPSVDTEQGCRLLSPIADKLKQKDQNDLDAIEEFTDDFIEKQHLPIRETGKKRLYTYGIGDDHVVVEITYIEPISGVIHVRTVDPAYERIEGVIEFESPVLSSHFSNKIYKNLKVHNRLLTTVTDPARGYFSFENQFIEFLESDTDSNYYQGDTLLAKCLKEISFSKTEKRLLWLSERGVGVYTEFNPNFKTGDVAELTFGFKGYNQSRGYINASIKARSEEEFNEYEVRVDCIQAFVESTPAVKGSTPEEKEIILPLNPDIPRIMARILYSGQRSLLKPSERFRFLCNARALANLVADNADASYLRFTSEYLQAVVSFATDRDMSHISLTPDELFAEALPVRLRMEIIDILREYGKDGYSERLADAIETHSEDMPIVVKLATLIQASNSVKNTLSTANLNLIKREIVNTLSIDTEQKVDLEADSRPHIGSEGQTVEFKTSIVYPPDNNMQPNQTLQTFNICRAICAFLNSMLGGTLYIGVNDSGYVTGLEEDFKYLRCNSFDEYSRKYIQDPLTREFGLDVMSYIHIDEAYNGDVAVVRVDPHLFRVVELNGIAYQRIDRESREMSEKAKIELVNKKIYTDSDKAKAMLMLQHAIASKSSVVLHGYASSNSGTISDRKVEPFKVYPEHGAVVCFDPQTMSNKVFNISRISNVEILDEPYHFPAKHKDIRLDAFHTSGDAPKRVSLELDLLAKNIMVEEYPGTKADIKACPGDTNKWYYYGTVYSLGGIGRFYIGLANHIRILDAPELLEYVKDYTSKYL